MASQKNFALTPSVSISRSKFRRPSQHKTTFNLGDLVPIYVDSDILPGDTVSLDLASLVRMSTPIAPIMDNIYIDYYAFFVPNRILWDKWKEFMGENESSYGAVTTEPDYPVTTINTNNGSFYQLSKGCLGDYMGLPLGLTAVGPTSSDAVEVSRLPGMAYFSIYSEWFRDQNLISPIRINKSVNGRSWLAQQGSIYYGYGSSLLKVAKESDYFTRALPFAQKGSPVKLPLGQYADVVASSSLHSMGNAIQMVNAGTIINGPVSIDNAGALGVTTGSGAVDAQLTRSNLVADLSNATAATINQLRFAFQYQKFLEKDAQPFYRASINRAISVNA